MSRIFILSLLLAAFSGGALAQRGVSSQPDPNAGASADQDRTMLGSPEEELRRRAAIRHEEASHKEMVERASEAAQLGEELRTTFERQQSLGRDELKKLERIEKLARKIRSSAGGSDDDEELKDPPAKLDAALTRLAHLSGELNKSVQKTSRLVVSGAVIENSNELIELIRHIRTFVQP